MTLTTTPLLNRLRQALIGLLALVVAVTSSQMVTARAQAAAVERIVICSGYGMMTVDLDAEGNPVGPVHLCPECMAAHLTGLLPGPAALPAGALHPLGFISCPAPEARIKPARGLLPEARGPPVTRL